ncbi:MAG TPA: hypothetical protein VNU47_00990 [Candidatus Paceibacterota bacterium]|nr:hypothetical protein [Candidatus Paceibacterota bacterium]
MAHTALKLVPPDDTVTLTTKIEQFGREVAEVTGADVRASELLEKKFMEFMDLPDHLRRRSIDQMLTGHFFARA